MRRWMALDVGTKTIGIAITDHLKVTARPLLTLTRSTEELDTLRISELADQYEIERLLVGMPRHLGGEKSRTADQIEPLFRSLSDNMEIPVEWSEERLSTKEAESLMAELGLSVADRRKRRNEFSAAVILKWFLEDSNPSRS